MFGLVKFARSNFLRTRAWLNGPSKDKVLIIWQCIVAAYLLSAIIAASISAGSFPPKKVDDGTLLLLYAIVVWSALALVAGIAILLRKAWGWWLEFLICAIPVFIYLPYIWIRGDKSPSSFADWVSLVGAFMMSVAAIYAINNLYKKARRETSMGTQDP